VSYELGHDQWKKTFGGWKGNERLGGNGGIFGGVMGGRKIKKKRPRGQLRNSGNDRKTFTGKINVVGITQEPPAG